MTERVSDRVGRLRPFVVMDVQARAKALEAAGRDIVHLEIGDPDFATPEVITRAAETSMEAGETGYSISLGRLDLREAVADHYRARYGVAIEPCDIVRSLAGYTSNWWARTGPPASRASTATTAP